MANSILTVDMITLKSLEILENNLAVTRNVNRQYDKSFANVGAKIGYTLRIRLPDRALVTDGAALGVADETQKKVSLTVATQKHIAVNFTTAELTMSLDDFAEIVLKPRISQLAASIDGAIAIAVQHQETIIALDPAGTSFQAIAIEVEGDAGVGGNGFDAVAVEVQGERVAALLDEVESRPEC